MKLPSHIAIIMDGNGRWASKRGLPRIAGHKMGAESVRTVVKSCLEKKIGVLTLFAFSIENWERPKEEVNYLLGYLFLKVIDDELAELHENGIHLRVIGDVARLDKKLQQKISEAETLTTNNTNLKLVIAVSYSGRWDITQAARKLCLEVVSGKITPDEINEEIVKQYICLSDLPEPDLLIRTSGEKRLSNFMLWQLAYTELYFTNTLWPEFREAALIDALEAYATRNRRFGKCYQDA